MLADKDEEFSFGTQDETKEDDTVCAPTPHGILGDGDISYFPRASFHSKSNEVQVWLRGPQKQGRHMIKLVHPPQIPVSFCFRCVGRWERWLFKPTFFSRNHHLLPWMSLASWIPNAGGRLARGPLSPAAPASQRWGMAPSSQPPSLPPTPTCHVSLLGPSPAPAQQTLIMSVLWRGCHVGPTWWVQVQFPFECHWTLSDFYITRSFFFAESPLCVSAKPGLQQQHQAPISAQPNSSVPRCLPSQPAYSTPCSPSNFFPS